MSKIERTEIICNGLVNEAFSYDKDISDEAPPLPPKTPCDIELRERTGSLTSQLPDRLCTDSDSGDECGWFGFQPKFLRRFRSPKWVLFWLCWASTTQGMVINGFINVVISTIEKRYHLKSANTGFIASFYDIGAVVCSIPVSYLGSLPGASKPRWLGTGLFIMGLGSFIFSIPHFSVPPYEVNSRSNMDGDLSSSVMLCLKQKNVSKYCEEASETWLSQYQYVFLLAQFLHGVGASPLYTLGIAYLDESVPLKMSSMYLGLFHAMAVIGPAAGYVIGGRLLGLYIDTPYVDPVALDITPDSELWLGAWWIGFLIAGMMAMSLSWIIIAFPAQLPGAKAREVERLQSKDHVSAKPFARLKHLPKAACVLLNNSTFLFLSIAEASEGAILAGFATFMPKIIENQYRFSAGFSALIFGIIAVPAGGGGTFLGGYIVKRFNMTCKTILKTCFLISSLVLICAVALVMSCPEKKFAGINVSYDDIHTKAPKISIESSCNQACSCHESNWDPVCGSNGVTYFSPCHAGCSKTIINDNNTVQVYENCKCLQSFLQHSGNATHQTSAQNIFALSDLSTQNSTQHSVSRQKCPSDCNSFSIFLACIGALMFLTFCLTMPAITATLRCVPDSHRSLALGLQGIQTRVLGTIPGPILFGAVVMDRACSLWQKTCDGVGSCRHYNLKTMSLSAVTLCLCLKVISTLLYYSAWRFYKEKDNQIIKKNKSYDLSAADLEFYSIE